MRMNEAFAQLRSAFIDWEGVLKDPQYIKRDHVITWPNAPAPILREPIHPGDISRLGEAGHFSCRIAHDDSIVQVFYDFADDLRTVRSARLAYYGLPASVDGSDAGETEHPVEPLDLPRMDLTASAAWFRIDYRNDGSVRILHPDCHLHVSGFPDTRFAVAGLPTPKQFIEFVISHKYPETYSKHRLLDDGRYREEHKIDNINEDVFPCGVTPHELYRRVPHFRIPGSML
jgi:Uncharacterized conserved protein (DUF2290)